MLISLDLPLGSQTLPVLLPAAAVGEVITPHEVEAVSDMAAAVRHVLLHPIGAPTLDRLAKPGQRVAIIVDDGTRSTPINLILPLVLAPLRERGIRREDIAIVIALGTHRPLTGAEIEARVGREVARQYRIVNISAEDDHAHVYMGTSGNGIPAWVKREVAEAELRIGIGCIGPHMNAGYSGGAKIILPGVCSRLTVETFHAKETDILDNQLGWLDSPIRRDLEQFVGDCVELDFIVNVIMTPDHQLYQCVAGHYIEAHRTGIPYAQDVYGVAVRRRYPVVIATAAPKDIDLYQMTNCIWAAERMIEDGGTMILVGETPERHSVYPMMPHHIGADPEALKRNFDADKVTERVSAIFAIGIGRFKRRFDMALVSSGLTKADADIMGLGYYDSVEAAVTSAGTAKSDDAPYIGVLTHGGMTLPLLTEES